MICNSKGKNSSKAFALPVEPATSDWAEADMKSKLAEITCVCVCEGIGQEGCPGQAEIVPLGLDEIHE